MDLIEQGMRMYPKKTQGSSDLFKEKYAAAFYEANPECVGKSYHQLANDRPNNSILEACRKEAVENWRLHKQHIADWEKEWPEAAAKMRDERDKESSGRFERKVDIMKSEIEFTETQIKFAERDISRATRNKKDVGALMYERNVQFEKLKRLQEELVAMEKRRR